MPADDDGRWWQLQLENKLFPVVEQWFQRTVRPPLAVAANSSLARDGKAYPPLPASHVAYGAMVTAVEHLEFLRVSFLATGRMLPPTAYFTLLRTALMGAAQALWVLKPANRRTRVEHALKIARDDIRQRRGQLSVELPPHLGYDDGVSAERTRLDRQLEQLQAAAAAVGLEAARVPQ